MKAQSLRHKTLLSSLILGLSLALSACQMTKNLDEMHDSTNEMNNTTAEMNRTTGKMSKTTVEMRDITKGMSTTTEEMRDITAGMSKTTDNLNDVTSEMYNALRQGDSIAARRAGLKALIDAKEGSPKISEAGKYMMSFEYQLWSGLGQDTKEVREHLAAEAAKEFMRDVHQFIDADQTKAYPLASALKNGEEDANRQQALNALAVAMHLSNPKQDRNLKNLKDVEPITMWSMIKESLVAAKAISESRKKISDFPEYVHQILIYESTARLLAQVRYNYFAAMMIARSSNIRNGAIAYAKMRYLNWTLDVSKFGMVEVQEFGVYLGAAMKTYDFMTKEAGMKPVVNNDLKKIFSHLKLSNQLKAAAATKDFKTATTRVSEEAHLIKLLKDYRRSAGIKEAL